MTRSANQSRHLTDKCETHPLVVKASILLRSFLFQVLLSFLLIHLKTHSHFLSSAASKFSVAFCSYSHFSSSTQRQCLIRIHFNLPYQNSFKFYRHNMISSLLFSFYPWIFLLIKFLHKDDTVSRFFFMVSYFE